MTSSNSKLDRSVSSTMQSASSMSANGNIILQRVPKESEADWTKNEEDDFSSWDSIDLDWMSRSDNDLQIAVPTTEKPEYETKVYQQSITLLIRLQKNETGVSASGYQDPLKVGPWKVSRDSIPVLVGSITGFCLLLIFGVSLTLYVCLNKKQAAKAYSVKSEASSVDSARSPKSTRSLSRDSLVLVTGPSSGHQARLISDPSASNNFLFDYSFDFYFNTPSQDSCTLKKDLTATSGLKADLSSELTSHLQRPSSLKERKYSQEAEENPSSISATLHVEVIANCIHTNVEGKQSKSPNWRGSDEKEHCAKIDSARPASLALRVPRENDNVGCIHEVNQRYTVLDKTISTTENTSGNFAAGSQDTCTTEEGIITFRNSLPNEAFKTRSLPAWVRSKSGPLASYCDLSSSLYDKNNCDLTFSKKKRNRMGSDAAQVIALSKSRIWLLSPGSSTSVSSSNHFASQSRTKETGFEEFINDAIIIYNERTAL